MASCALVIHFEPGPQNEMCTGDLESILLIHGLSAAKSERISTSYNKPPNLGVICYTALLQQSLTDT